MSWKNEIKKESAFYTKSKLKQLLKTLESDMDDSSKVAHAKGFVEGMLKVIGD